MRGFSAADFFTLRKQDFVQAAIAAGLPHAVDPVPAHAAQRPYAGPGDHDLRRRFGAILWKASLSFLGLGLVDESSWGGMLNQARAGGTGFVWWIAMFPGLAIFLTVFAYNLVGEAIRDALDPKLRSAIDAGPITDRKQNLKRPAHGTTTRTLSRLLEVIEPHDRLRHQSRRDPPGATMSPSRVFPGQTVAIVGESGCGKSVTALSILRLIPQPPGKVLGGQILLEGRDLLTLPEREMRAVRGKEIAMIFQEPMTSLNPVYTIGDQIVEAITLHQGVSTRQAYQDRGGGAARCRHRRPAPAHPRISASDVRRNAAAGDDRDGALLQAEAADCR